jgi:hypothetical protein
MSIPSLIYIRFLQVFVITCSILLLGCSKKEFDPNLQNEQDALFYLDRNTAHTPIITPSVQEKLHKKFLEHYYSPWTDENRLFTNEEIKEYTLQYIEEIKENPGWDANEHKHNKEWVEALTNNMDMSSYPNHISKAITTQNTNLRGFPTYQPSFSSLDKPGSTYPFDNFQASFIPTNSPVLMLQTTKDKNWYLVATDSAFGWINANDIALVNDAFIEAWQNNQGYISVKSDDTAILDANNVFKLTSFMGAILPIKKISEENYEIQLAIKTVDGYAQLTDAIVPHDRAYKIPLPMTSENVAKVVNQFLGTPYGWGGIHGYRDCSATIKDLTSYFGIWLPRNSSMQSKIGDGKRIDLTDLSNTEKIKIIQQAAIPYATLLYMPGHIMLYVGEKDGTLYAFHNMWGLHTTRLFGPDGRAVVGRAVITPIDFGKTYPNVKKSLLDKLTAITIITQDDTTQ